MPYWLVHSDLVPTCSYKETNPRPLSKNVCQKKKHYVTIVQGVRVIPNKKTDAVPHICHTDWYAMI